MFFSKKASTGVDWLIVCLGNPGDKYENTRHNVGYMVGDALAERHNIPLQKVKFRALVNTITIGGSKALLMKPVTFMNLSGESVIEAATFYKLPPEKILVVSDDVSLPAGKLRIRREGSAGGHNGLKNIQSHLESDKFPRIKIGVGEKPHPDYDMAHWVLGKFTDEDREVITAAALTAADAVEVLITDGIDEAMQKFN